MARSLERSKENVRESPYRFREPEQSILGFADIPPVINAGLSIASIHRGLSDPFTADTHTIDRTPRNHVGKGVLLERILRNR
jgi:hypothetical protein